MNPKVLLRIINISRYKYPWHKSFPHHWFPGCDVWFDAWGVKGTLTPSVDGGPALIHSGRATDTRVIKSAALVPRLRAKRLNKPNSYKWPFFVHRTQYSRLIGCCTPKQKHKSTEVNVCEHIHNSNSVPLCLFTFFKCLSSPLFLITRANAEPWRIGSCWSNLCMEMVSAEQVNRWSAAPLKKGLTPCIVLPLLTDSCEDERASCSITWVPQNGPQCHQIACVL